MTPMRLTAVLGLILSLGAPGASGQAPAASPRAATTQPRPAATTAAPAQRAVPINLPQLRAEMKALALTPEQNQKIDARIEQFHTEAKAVMAAQAEFFRTRQKEAEGLAERVRAAVQNEDQQAFQVSFGRLNDLFRDAPNDQHIRDALIRDIGQLLTPAQRGRYAAIVDRLRHPRPPARFLGDLLPPTLLRAAETAKLAPGRIQTLRKMNEDYTAAIKALDPADGKAPAAVQTRFRKEIDHFLATTNALERKALLDAAGPAPRAK